MHVLREHLHVLDWGGRQDAVTKVEDVSRAASRTSENLFRLVEHATRRPEQERRVEVALHRAIESDLLPGLVDRHAPVDANHVATCFTQLFEHHGGPGAEM